MSTHGFRALMTNLVDYAGLFPPAKLDMAPAARAFATHRAGGDAWVASRFVLPVSRLGEFARVADPHLPKLSASRNGTNAPAPAAELKAIIAGKPTTVPVAGQPGEAAAQPENPCPEPWTLSVLLEGSLDENLRAIEAFNQGHYRDHHYSAVVDTVEVRVSAPESVDNVINALPEELYPFFEVPVTQDPRGYAAALAGTGAGAKIRTGGVTPELFPSIDQVSDFLHAMAAAEVPIKATAGLHHPVRGPAPLTYEQNSPMWTMHGYVNVFLAAAFVYELELDKPNTIHLLGETNPDAFHFREHEVEWRGVKLTADQLKHARENFAICYGCCSLDEPVADARRQGWM